MCVISSRKSHFPEFPGINIFAFQLNGQESSRALFKKGIESGCQAFIVSDKYFENFLEFFDIHDDCIQVFPNKRVIVYQDNVDEKIGSQWKNSSSIHGEYSQLCQWSILISCNHTDLPNVLFLEYEREFSKFKLLTTKFVGIDAHESLNLLTLAEFYLHDDFTKILFNMNLYPEKLSNMHGKEVVLALFNYLPYVLWKEVVSTQ